tara:strand:- start:1476 stop:3278 length:1803 start_codon:yes stop_codon:yes gene_type:complete
MSELHKRTLEFQTRAVDEEKRTVELAFSSENPVERSFGYEVLDHSEGAVDLQRLNGGAALLVNHNTDDQVGVVDNARVDDDRVGRATVRFGNSERAQEIFRDVQDGIRRLVSVGYHILDTVRSEVKDGLDTVTATRWMPVEISLVAVPADATGSGVGRSVEENPKSKESVEETRQEPETKKMDTENITEAPKVQVVNENEVRSAESKRAKEIAKLGDQYNCMDDALNAIQEGRSAGEFSRYILDNKLNEKPLEVPTDDGEIGMNDNEVRDFSITRAVDTFCNKGRFEGLEAEVSEAAKQRYGRNVDGLCVPTDVLKRDLNVGTAVDGGNTVATNILAGSFIDLLRNNSVIAQTGATYLNGLSGDVAIPRQSAAATASWLGEVAAVSETSAQIDQVTMSPKGLSAMTTYSKQLLAQSSIDIEQFVRNDLATVLAVAQDLAAVDGTGSSDQPKGIMNETGVGTITVNANNYINAVNLESEVAVDNALTGSLAYVTNAKYIGKLKQSEVASNTGRFVYENGQVNGYPCYMSNQMPATYATNTKSAIIFGNFSDLLIGNWNGLDIVVDPFTEAAKRQVRLVTSLWTDIAVRHAESFSFSKLVVH